MNELMSQLVTQISHLSSQILLPFMAGVFLFAVFFRWVIYFTVRCQFRFSQEFEKRVHKYLAHEDESVRINSFHMLAKKVLESTYYEHFELKRKFRRRRFDTMTSITDRLFLIREGAARLIKDTLSQTQYLKKDRGEPQFLEVSKFVFGSNPTFNKVLGALPMGMFHDLINILPGLFVVGGIFGTFIGVMNGLPALSSMDISNVELTQKTMGAFIGQMAYSMGTSIVGILLSVMMTVFNSLFSPDSLYLQTVSKYASALEFLWSDTLTNERSRESLQFKAKSTMRDRRGLDFQTTVNPIMPGIKEDPLEEETGINPFELARADIKEENAKISEPERRQREIELRIQMLDVYTKMSAEDYSNGIISETIWREKSEEWISERQNLENELKNIKMTPMGRHAA